MWIFSQNPESSFGPLMTSRLLWKKSQEIGSALVFQRPIQFAETGEFGDLGQTDT